LCKKDYGTAYTNKTRYMKEEIGITQEAKRRKMAFLLL
jgi:hypothetical protein